MIGSKYQAREGGAGATGIRTGVAEQDDRRKIVSAGHCSGGAAMQEACTGSRSPAARLIVPDDTTEIRQHLMATVAGLRDTWSHDPRIRSIVLTCPTRNVSTAFAATLAKIVHELVSHRCKHAYCDGASGDVRAAFSAHQGQFVLLVADDGTGTCPVGRSAIPCPDRDLVADLASQLGAVFRYLPAVVGTIALLCGPLGSISADVNPPRFLA